MAKRGQWTSNTRGKNTASCSTSDCGRIVPWSEGNGTKDARTKFSDVVTSTADENRIGKASSASNTTNAMECVGVVTSSDGSIENNTVNSWNNEKIWGTIHNNAVEDEWDGTTICHTVTKESEAREPTLCCTRLHWRCGKIGKTIGKWKSEDPGGMTVLEWSVSTRY